MTAHQAIIRQREAARLHVAQIANLQHAFVRAITRSQARPLIETYEWLGTLGRATARYGLFSGRKAADVANLPDYCNIDGDELIGVACFGRPASPQAGDICGKPYRHLAIALERGACVHWAPKNAASYLITHAVRAAHREHGWSIVYAYADSEAGEIGTVYQAANWHYIGQGVGRAPGRAREVVVGPDGRARHDRGLRRLKLKPREAKLLGYELRAASAKHKYIVFAGEERVRKRLCAALRYPVLPYPKRSENGHADPTGLATQFGARNGVPAPGDVAGVGTPINSRCSYRTVGVHVEILVRGRLELRFALDDKRARELALVRIVKRRYATQREVANAFGVSPQSQRRYARDHECGLDALGGATGYPRGRQRDPHGNRRILRLLERGWSRRRIARHLGITEAAVRQRLLRLTSGSTATADVTLAR